MPSIPPGRLSEAPEPNADDSSAAFLVRAGSGLAMASLATLFAIMPAAIRTARATTAVGSAAIWVGLAAVALLPMLVSVFVFRRARVGLAAFGGSKGGARGVSLLVLLAALGAFASVLGRLLRATTHHFGLAGATFGVTMALVGAGLAIASVRLFRFLEALGDARRRVVTLAILVTLLLGLVLVVVRVGSVMGVPDAVLARANMLDVLAFAVAGILAAQPTFVPRRLLAYAGPPLAVAIVVAGGFGLSRTAPLVHAIVEHCPVYGALVSVVLGPT